MVTLYKNVDIKELINITEKGILSMDECGNNPWVSGQRAKNRTDVVYLFSPTHPEVKNSLINYGIVLLQVSVPKNSVKKNMIGERDTHIGEYTEYIIDKVPAECITEIFIPSIFKGRIEEHDKEERLLPPRPITWCDTVLSEWNGPFSKERLDLFVKTAPIAVTQFNYLRGVDEKRHMIDINEDNIIYKIDKMTA